jgi:hypothetical protein
MNLGAALSPGFDHANCSPPLPFNQRDFLNLLAESPLTAKDNFGAKDRLEGKESAGTGRDLKKALVPEVSHEANDVSPVEGPSEASALGVTPSPVTVKGKADSSFVDRLFASPATN